MNTKSLLLVGILGVAFVALLRKTIDIFNEEDEEQELDSHEEEYGFPLFI